MLFAVSAILGRMSVRFSTLVVVCLTLAAIGGGFAATWPEAARALHGCANPLVKAYVGVRESR